MLEIRLLGCFEVRLDGRLISIPSRPAQSLFAFLALNSKTSHRREKLAGVFWPDSTDEQARDYLRHAIWRIRKSLDSMADYFITDDLSIAFNRSQPHWLDTEAVEQAAKDGPADALLSNLSAYGGELLPGFYDDWILLEREHLQFLFDQKMTSLMVLLEVENRWHDMLEQAERWISLGQTPEPAYRALMTAHAAMGEMSKVAAAYARCEKALRDFGIQPSGQTTRLFSELKSGYRPAQSPPVSLAPPAMQVSSNIPIPLTTFIGRRRDLDEVARILSSSRLLTLTGSGGVGKTRLAIEAARQAIHEFDDGVFWVSLVGLSDSGLVPQEIAQALGLLETPSRPLMDTIKSHLKQMNVLIVLDNCEHMIRACAEYCEQLLAACPKLKIMATSIEGMGLFSERIWQVPSLALPDSHEQRSLKELGEIASVALFEERAANSKPGFALNAKNAPWVIQICQRLDGIPLALELAAARTKVLSVDEIAARLDDRFSLLTAGNRTAIPRHQTLRAAIDWSHDLLTDPERILFRRLSVFAGSFTLDAVESICAQQLPLGNILDLLGRLVDKSLVIVEKARDVGQTRYRLLETIRQYALERFLGAGEAPAIRDRHLDFYVGLAERSEQNMIGSQAAVWFDRLDRELDNLRGAMEWSTSSGNAMAALRIAGSLVYFWFAHGLLASEWHDRIQQALSTPEGRKRTSARSKALNGIGFMYWADLYPIDRRPELEEALSIARDLGDAWNMATALRNLGLLENIQGNYREARSFLEKSLEIWGAMGQAGRMGKANTLMYLGDVALNQNEAGWARSLYEDSALILRELAETNLLAYTVRRLAQLAWRSRDYHNALSLCEESLSMNQRVRDPRGTVACLAAFAAIAAAQGKFGRAAILVAAVEAQLDLMGIRLLFVDQMEFEQNVALVRKRLKGKKISALWVKGRGMTLEAAIQFALDGID